ncbi:hypothetical protein CROQUDRAFT_668440 [Cronartium quercuum f. sp. fusiforme G11]|uniref:CHY-type domain-containing protein n=1 Tax=Cronartium quercuum f. sp. fusiforme G11 TaxID=708437 RepID=A0A9P6TFL6_9BASI|nr:hypothetical protein CROQUDRAFT_668440 [Cronartium quercuum f. sp. fusiforme G11]
MCKHILNAQVSIRSPCCQKWFDCAECHEDQKLGHRLVKTNELVMACKACKKVFRKAIDEFEDADEYCPHCDNHYVIEAKTPRPMLGVEGEDARVDGRGLSNRDERAVDVERKRAEELAKLWEEEGEKLDF